MLKPANISYAIVVLTLALVAWLDLATPFLTILFSYFALSRLRLWKQTWLAIALFLLLVTAIFSGFVFFLNRAFVALPAIVSTAIPAVVRYAEAHGIELPFTDIESLKTLALDSVQESLHYLGNFATIATKEFVFLAVGVVVAVGVFVNPKLDLHEITEGAGESLYSVYCTKICERFSAFFSSFDRVMGAQILIAAINTVFTAIFVYAASLRYASIVVMLTFVCGLLPIIGNLISNTVIVGVAFTISPKLAGWALIFLVFIHKLEYFLNSKIIGSRIRNPMWLTLLALVVGERLMGIAGIILAPVLLDFLKIEGSKIPADSLASSPAEAVKAQHGG